MTKTGSTKNKILNQLADGNKTLSDLSRILGLAPSTVSQHLKELGDMGAVKEVENEHIRKWKYYELNPEFNYEGSPIGTGIVVSKIQRRVFYYIMGLGVIVVLAYLALSMAGPGAPGLKLGNTTYVPISLTDPPSVPNGTQSLVMAYSQVAIHTNGQNGGSWIYSNNSGSVDLMSLLNVSQVVAGVNIPNNSQINMVKFNISSAKIEINNTTYNVTVPNDEVTAHVSGSLQLNSSSGLLVDLFPTVVAIYTNSSTVFVMVPSVKAVLTPKGNGNGTVNVSISKFGNRSGISREEFEQLESAGANVIASNGSIMAANGTMHFSITVTNYGASNVVLRNILVVGRLTPVILYNSTCYHKPNGNGNMIPFWCRLNGDGNAQGAIGVHDASGSTPRLPARAMQLFTDNGNLGISAQDAGSSVGQMDSSLNSSVVSSIGGSLGIIASGNAGSSANAGSSGGVATSIGSGPSASESEIQSNSMLGSNASMIANPPQNFTNLLNFKIGKGAAGIGDLVDVRVGSKGDATAVFKSENNISLNNSALYDLIVPHGENNETAINSSGSFNNSEDPMIIPRISFRRALDFAVN
ncbi:MAG: helix-turn-helix transcriptional regulator, partial [Candidatus Micrarchaeota archaeon]|nr:helix-turn-helix transcriptional regulator [Candidatus Micrarchaeota archaeon]